MQLDGFSMKFWFSVGINSRKQALNIIKPILWIIIFKECVGVRKSNKTVVYRNKHIEGLFF